MHLNRVNSLNIDSDWQASVNAEVTKPGTEKSPRLRAQYEMRIDASFSLTAEPGSRKGHEQTVMPLYWNYISVFMHY